MKKELLKGLTEEQIAKVKACKSQEELLALAKAEGIELNDEQLAAVNGGVCTCTPSFKCPHSKDYKKLADYQISGCSSFRCNQCGYEWSL